MSTLVPTEVSAPTSMSASAASTLAGSSSTVSTSGHSNVTSGVLNVIKTEEEDIELDEMEVVAGSNLVEGEIHHHQQQQLATVMDDQAGGQAKMTLGQMALAGIVISSGPGDHFETYEGMPIFLLIFRKHILISN